MKYRIIAIFTYVFFSGFFSLFFTVQAADKKVADERFSGLHMIAGDTVREPIYVQPLKNKGRFYDWLWGTRYRELYSIPISAPVATFATLKGGVQVVKQMADFQGLLLENKQHQLFLLKPLGGSASLMQSKSFQEVYNKADFKGTYVDELIGEAYTIINPFTFALVDGLARSSGLTANRSQIYYIPQQASADTVADGSSIQDKLVHVIDIPDLNIRPNIYTTDEMLRFLQENKHNQVNQEMYIRERLLDMLVGDWNKTSENWNWRGRLQGDSLLLNPVVINRNHAFTKVDGIMFKQVLKMLSLDFIINYDSVVKPKDLKKLNKLGFAIDMAVASQSTESLWLEQARFLQENLTDSVINASFRLLPEEVQSAEIDLIASKLKRRRDSLPLMARQYYKDLQRTPVLTGTNQDDYFLIERSNPDSIQIAIYDSKKREKVFDKQYSRKQTKEIWLYGLKGNDTFHVSGHARKELPISLISGDGENTFDLSSRKKVDVYKDFPYDYEKIKYHDIAFSPWGVYDSDNGISLGAYFTYTEYGFKRAPFTFQHRIGYNYIKGFEYQAIFPNYDGRKSFYLNAFIGSPRNYLNFFGFGNNTDGYKEEKKNYNRVKLRNFTLTPSFHWELSKEQNLVFYSTLQLYKARHTDNRFIDQVYSDDHRIFKANYYLDLGGTYQMSRNISRLFPNITTTLSTGWVMNLLNPERNYPYTNASFSWNMKLTRRFTWASLVNGMLLYNNKYEFFQSATIDLRGYRDNRFIGKQSFYQYSDFRVDMGKLDNPLTPLKYGLFAGFDYGRVWYPGERSKKWHTSYGGGIWLTFLNKFTTKYSWFGSTDSFRFMLELGLGF